MFSLIFGWLRLSLGNLIFQCHDFDIETQNDCGTNILTHKWIIHDAESLPKIFSNAVDIYEVLYMNNTDGNLAEYRLYGPPRLYMSTLYQMCVQFASLSSDNCYNDQQTNQVCTANVTVRSSLMNGLIILPTREFNFEDQGWQVYNFEFNFADRSVKSKANLQILLSGFIIQNKSLTRKQFDTSIAPYIGIKYIDIFNGTCSERIGPRSE